MSNRKLIRHTFVAALLGLASVTACANLPLLGAFGAGGGQSSAHRTSTVTTSETHTINGHPVDADGNREGQDDDDQPRAKHARNDGGDFGATCQHNSDCASNTCFVGAGELGYCTKMCDSFSECPSYWECEKTGNAPQKICQQDND